MTQVATSTTTISENHHGNSSPGVFCHTHHSPCLCHHHQQQQQQHLAIFFSPAMTSTTTDTSHPSIPGTWVDTNLHYCHCQTAAAAAAAAAAVASDHQEDMNSLKQTIASLRDQAKKLEMTDLMVKKSIQVVAKKRRLAQHSSQWDWCDPLDDDDDDDEEDDDEDDHGMESFHSFHSDSKQINVPVLDTDASETDHSMDDVQVQVCDSDWEWVD